MHNQNAVRGFTLIELMIVMAIIGFLVQVALPAYESYSSKAQFTEVVLAAGAPQTAIYVAVTTASPSSLDDLDGGSLGIPAAIPLTATDHGVTVVDGVITVTWRDDGSLLDGQTYILTPSSHTPPVTWTASGTCQAAGYC